MRSKFLISSLLFFFLLSSGSFAYFEDTGAVPPADNEEPPINVGADAQRKSGNLSVESFTARDGVELGGQFRDGWKVTCDWQGTKCFCRSDTSSTMNVRMTLGLTCDGAGQLADFRLIELDVSGQEKLCGSDLPTGCTSGLYNFNNPSSASGFKKFTNTVVSAVTSVVVTTVNFFKRVFSKWF